MEKKRNVTDRIQQYKNASAECQTEEQKQACQSVQSPLLPEIICLSETAEERGKGKERKGLNNVRKKPK